MFYRVDRRRPVFAFQGVKMAIGICADCSGDRLMGSYGRRKVQVVLMWVPLADSCDRGVRSRRLYV